MNLTWVHTNVHSVLDDGMPAQGSHTYWVLCIEGHEIGRAWPRIGRWHATTRYDPPTVEFGSRDEAFRFVLNASPLTNHPNPKETT